MMTQKSQIRPLIEIINRMEGNESKKDPNNVSLKWWKKKLVKQLIDVTLTLEKTTYS